MSDSHPLIFTEPYFDCILWVIATIILVVVFYFFRIYCLDNCKPRASLSRKFIAKVSVNCSSQVEFYGIVENLYFFQHHEKALPTSSRSVHFGNFQSNNALLYLNVVWSHDLPLITENLHLIAMVYHWCLHMSFWIGSFDWLISGPIRLNFNT